MLSTLFIFFIEFASSRYLARIDEKVMVIQLRESGNQETVIEPVAAFLARRKIVINGKHVEISEALAGQRVVETLVINAEDLDMQERIVMPGRWWMRRVLCCILSWQMGGRGVHGGIQRVRSIVDIIILIRRHWIYRGLLG